MALIGSLEALWEDVENFFSSAQSNADEGVFPHLNNISAQLASSVGIPIAATQICEVGRMQVVSRQYI